MERYAQRQRLILRQLLAARNNDRHRARRDDFLEVIAVIGLDELHAHLGHDAGRELEEAVGALHILADSHNAQRRDAVTACPR